MQRAPVTVPASPAMLSHGWRWAPVFGSSLRPQLELLLGEEILGGAGKGRGSEMREGTQPRKQVGSGQLPLRLTEAQFCSENRKPVWNTPSESSRLRGQGAGYLLTPSCPWLFGLLHRRPRGSRSREREQRCPCGTDALSPHPRKEVPWSYPPEELLCKIISIPIIQRNASA